MDEFEKRLKNDAERIEAVASDELQKRIDASLAVERETRRIVVERPRSQAPMWWISTITGLAAVLAVIIVLNWNVAGQVDEQDRLVEVPSPTPAPTAEWDPAPIIDWDARSADLTSPLEQELENLQSDLEKARRNMERDMRLAF